MTRRFGYGCATVSILLVSFAQLAMKWGMLRLPPAADLVDLMPTADSGLLSVLPLMPWAALSWVFAGLAAYGFSLVAWLGALSHLPLSQAYPLLSLSYVLVYLIANGLGNFGESWSLQALLGIAVIMAGVWLVTSSAPKPDDRRP